LKGYKLFAKTAVKDALFVGLLLLVVDMAAVIWSEQYISSGIVSIIAAATAIWFVVLDRPKWKENFSSLPTVLGLIFGFIGVFMLFAEQLFAQGDSAGDNSIKILAMCVLVGGRLAGTVCTLIII